MQNSWNLLLDRLGIAKSYTDAAQNRREYVTDDETLLKMVNYLGFKLDKIEDSDKLLAKLEKERWLYALEPIYVLRYNALKFDVVLPKNEVECIEIVFKNQQTGDEPNVLYSYKIIEEKMLGRKEYARVEIKLDNILEPAYYEVDLTAGSSKSHTVLAVTPDKCYEPEYLRNHKIWGMAVQLYSLTSKRNWGVGDFTDLSDLVNLCARQGANIIGLNPLNVLFHDFPENASPYSSISRLFLNPIYIDVEKVNGYKPEYLAGKEAELEQLRAAENIDYTGVYNFKMQILQKIYDSTFAKLEKSAGYQKFEKKNKEDLENLATYQALYSSLCHSVYGGWRAWPREFKNPQSPEVKKFRAENRKAVNFFKFLQYWAEKQLEDVQKEIEQCGLKIGLYRDLPVGLCKDSAELWSENELFIKDCGAGAPPDIFFPTGQKWCLGAFNPYKLKANAYRPFIKILQAAMTNAGAIRIDHVMSLQRLYIIPDDSAKGTYIYYPFADMLGILALESHLHKCMVVGESIGNVPEGFIEAIQERGVYSLSVLWSERWNGSGPFKLPQDFAPHTFCSIGTHDMAPLKMRWFGGDIETMYNLKMLTAEERQNQYKGREAERRCLLDALDYTHSWSADRIRQCDCLYGEGYPNGIMEATERYLSSSACAVFLAQPEDIFGVNVLQNLPGTDRDKHPNWRRKLPVKLEDFEQNDDFSRAVAAIGRKLV